MRGSVVQKGGRWYVKIELDPDPLTGRRHQKWHSGYRTKKDAERARTDILSKLDRGATSSPHSRPSVRSSSTGSPRSSQPSVRRRSTRIHGTSTTT